MQVTAGKTHTFKLANLDSMLTSLGLGDGVRDGVRWSHLEFMILRPEDDNREFTLKLATGGLQSYKRFDGKEWDRKDYRNNVQYATLGWEH